MHILLGVVMALALSAPLEAAAPQRINFQGRLTDAGGNPVTGSKSVTFSIWNAASAGGQLWSEARSVAVSTGVYNVALGEVVALSSAVFSAPDRWLQLQVEADPAMTPRIKLQSVAYALRAERAGGLSDASGIDVATANTGGLNVTGTVAAGAFSGDGAGLTNLPSSSLLFPGGLQGLTSVWRTVSLGNSYTVPAGKNLYIQRLMQPEEGPWGPLTFNGTETNVVNLLLGPGTVIASTAATTTLGGFLLPNIVTAVFVNLAPSASYTVPAGSLFIAFSASGFGYSINGLPAGGNPATLIGLQPLILAPGTTITNTGTTDRVVNGYLMPQ